MPTSFNMNLYEPLYASRQTLGVPSAVVVAPRQYEAALDKNKTAAELAPPPAVSRGVGSGYGRGIVVGEPGGVVSGVLGGVLSQQADVSLQPGFSNPIQVAEASRNEDYFEYRFPFPVRLGSRQSALLPFLNKPIKAERVSIYKAGADRDHPLNGAWIENNGDLPLEPGPVTFFQNSKYAGETVVDYLSRGEKRLVSYGVDYDIQAETRLPAPRPETIVSVTVARGVMVSHFESTQTTSYRFRNKGQDDKTLVLEHPRNTRRTLKDITPEETSATAWRFRIALRAGQQIEFPVVETVDRQTTVTIRSLDRPAFEAVFAAPEFLAELRAKLQDILTQRDILSSLQAEKAPIDDSIKSIFADQQRLRENLKALTQRREDRDLHQKYLAQLDAQEQQVKDLRARLENLTRQIASHDAVVSKSISDLTWN
jgi:hypothetical protein